MDSRRRDHEEQSMFETSHVLGALLASTPLLPEAWRQCTRTSGTSDSWFGVHRVDDVIYVAFAAGDHHGYSVDEAAFMAAVDIGSGGHGLFSPLDAGRDEEPVMVQAAAMQSFLAMFATPLFQMLINEIVHKTVILTGHCTGGSLASLTTLHLLSLLSCSGGPSPASILCITFGSPLLGNTALSRAILRERWGNKFLHVVSQEDIIPRLLFCPPNSIPEPLIFHILQASRSSSTKISPIAILSDREKVELHKFILMHTAAAAEEGKLSNHVKIRRLFRPFGSYMLCSREGAVCLDNSVAITRMLHLTFASGFLNSRIEESQSYGDLMVKICEKLLMRKNISMVDELEKSNYSASVLLALQASGLNLQDMGFLEAQECFKMCRRMGRSPNLNCANLSVKLAKITPRRAQIEWYKALCDSDRGYYDSFKYRGASRRDSMVNMNRIKLATFWDNVVDMLQSNQLPHDFHHRGKWINAAHFYRLLVEPLDIAEYYRTEMHKKTGHYLVNGREKRYDIFDRWWREGKKDLKDRKRSKFAGLTQDSCFWARVEEARELILEAKRERDHMKLAKHLEDLNVFECYAKNMVESKEVSIDVIAPRSSYSLWVHEWKELKFDLSNKTSKFLEDNGLGSINMLA